MTRHLRQVLTQVEVQGEHRLLIFLMPQLHLGPLLKRLTLMALGRPVLSTSA